ncbi:MAG TPA: hypothetical protein PLD73_11960 [Candidatus Hydrogenedentes bacterium]|nr:hypothetical protein [Candidatus Hydrogenedentota bacterium]HPJ99054.1 hypothetical protein [Candidatus Hydrogenedentota bacterium]
MGSRLADERAPDGFGGVCGAVAGTGTVFNGVAVMRWPQEAHAVAVPIDETGMRVLWPHVQSSMRYSIN